MKTLVYKNINTPKKKSLNPIWGELLAGILCSILGVLHLLSLPGLISAVCRSETPHFYQGLVAGSHHLDHQK